jgi:hypothetical protein
MTYMGRLDVVVGAKRVEPRGIEPLTSALPARVVLVHGSSWGYAIGDAHPHR